MLAQSNQAALRFQLNSKRYSNTKEGSLQPMSGHKLATEARDPPSRESALRHRLGKKNPNYYYDAQK